VKLSLIRPYRSLIDLPELELPDFVLLTGQNGAGKTHLLEALRDGAATADIAPQSDQDVRLFNWGTLSPRVEESFSSEILTQERVALFNSIKNLYDQQWGLQSIFTQARALGIRGPLVSDIEGLVQATVEDLKQFSTEDRAADDIKRDLDSSLQQLAQTINNHLQPFQQRQLRSIAENSGRHIVALRERDFLDRGRPVWGEAELFQQSFGRLFVSYRDLQLFNWAARAARDDGQSDAKPLTNEEFEHRFGPPPWDFVNGSLRAADVSFEIDSPNRYSLDPYKPTLRKLGSNAEISFDGLSSGERVIMAFAFAVYYVNDSRQAISRPKLLLLDEIDAPLHPSRCRNLLATIQHVLVQRYGLKVIMATHSASTVALAPEEAIHVMRPGIPGIHKVSKDGALSDLTDGVPILSVSYDGRRQVFVESPRDVEVYQAAFEGLRRRYIDTELSLNFIATGVETSDGRHVNTGCDVVKRIVSELRKAGARHTFGLIDWDNKNVSDDGIVVAAEGERDGLESIMFDPLLLLNTLVKLSSAFGGEIGLPSLITYLSLSELEGDELQRAIDEVQKRVLGRDRGASEIVRYADGRTLLVDGEYLRMNDHDLEKKVESAFPALKSVSKGRVGVLARWIAREIINERPEHSPACLLKIFSDIVAR